MTFYLDEINDYFGRAYFYCPEKELDFSVDVRGVFGDPDEEPTPEEFKAFCERCDSAFGEAFGEGVGWKF